MKVPNSCFIVLFLALASAAFFCNASSSSSSSTDKDANQATNVNAGLNLRAALPAFSKWVHFDCGSGGGFDVGPGKIHEWIIPTDKVESCHATWGHSEATFSAWDPNRDIGHASVFWLAKLDGFFRSWDNVNWEQGASWEH